ncbi:histone-lysine N-methyltransferase, H3 lysine-36 specific-like [Actinia tenebrosa]|uniref:Histone-lysine N-methyltransferase, H3 lysine-36 specific-like n=1 Tax=Actinia tenebrosa TaxID=6105 RepID=A0A6P8HFE5_ACTTE|nr:histone-lysine N-methyltransferase, H3 lysine-36 specific-like [Actinia tenebrosa]XP_031551316.1 histone-lysine N-methyltransferase, H3 lysine-36 specific-like [Actinia tenebrosa]XP_031551317.1 histone-lysine N-methyltransferase, H3 lysine-36 specific-like [Actinia tenebrosa]
MDADCVEVVEIEKNFSSLTAKHDIPRGTFLGDFWGKVRSEVAKHTLQIGINKHIDCLGKTKYTNHSCSPNAHFVYSQYQGSKGLNLQEDEELSWHLVASRDIKKGEAITFDYTLTEYSTAEAFDCLCKSQNCLGRVQGFKFLPAEEKKKRMDRASPFVIELFEKENR